jgi:catabolite regulation protein CreA
MKLFTALAALTLIAAPTYAGTHDQSYAAGALYGATCAVVTGRASKSQAGLALAMTLREKGISINTASDPKVKQVALLLMQKSGCR